MDVHSPSCSLVRSLWLCDEVEAVGRDIVCYEANTQASKYRVRDIVVAGEEKAYASHFANRPEVHRRHFYWKLHAFLSLPQLLTSLLNQDSDVFILEIHWRCFSSYFMSGENSQKS